MPLQDRLDELKAERLALTPPEVMAARKRAVGGLIASGLAESAVRAGEHAPAFRLRDGEGGVFSLRNALVSAPVLIIFYRGRWCPYCNLELQAIESAAGEIRSLGATIVAVSQQTPEASLETARLNGLSFPSLVDRGGRVANSFGLRWNVPSDLRDAQESCGSDLAVFNGEKSWTMTMPARYVVSRDGMVEYADISIDYTRRGDPSDLFPVLHRLGRGATH